MERYIQYAKKHETAAAMGVLVLLTLIASCPLFQSGWYQNHDAHLVKRVFALSNEIGGGAIYPRWLSLTYRGLGSPFFNFYSPGYYLAAAYLHILGVPLLAAIKAVCFALFFIGGVGMYFWARRRFAFGGSVLASTLFLYTPYHFFDIYVRGAMAEFSALAVMPFLFWGIDLTFEEKDRLAGPALIAFGAAAILLTHHLSALIVAPLAVVYIACLAAKDAERGKTLVRILLGGGVAVGATAFFWLPVITEVKYLADLRSSVTSGYFNYNDHFVYPRQFFDTSWGFGVSKPGLDDTVSFQIGVVIVLFTLASTVVLALPFAKNRRALLLLPALGVLGLLLTTSLAKPLYDALPGFAFIQFPWRYLGPATLFLALFGGFAADTTFTARISPGWQKTMVAIAGVTLCILASTEQRQVKGSLGIGIVEKGVLSETEIAGLHLSGLCDRHEYTSKWANLPLLTDLFPFIDGGVPISEHATVTNAIRGHSGFAFDATSDNPATAVVLPLFYFPGWVVEIDGAETPAEPDDLGLITFTLPRGRHHVTARFADTLPRILGWIVAAATLMGVSVWWGWRRNRLSR